MMESDSLEQMARDWVEIFFGIIPEDKLRTCYVAAEQNPNRRVEDRNFPLRRREILDAWYRLEAMEPKKEFQCDFCALYFAKPEEYEPCPWHKKAKDLIGR